MTTTNNLTAERIAEIKAFKTTDFSDCPIQTAEELAEFRPRHPEYFAMKKAVRLSLDADVLAWFKRSGKGYQSRINTALRSVIQHAGTL
jgi:uncharacterized protein (DUF4415 family)